MQNFHLITIAFLTLPSCSAQERKTADESVITDGISFLRQKQVLFTNEAYFEGDRSSSGASIFLTKFNDSIYAVTAKHLLGADMGIEPAVDIADFDSELEEWLIYPRASDSLAEDEITTVSSLIKEVPESKDDDIIVLRLGRRATSAEWLEPDFSPVIIGQTVYLIGCAYADKDCKQNFYQAVITVVDGNYLEVAVKDTFALAGFSGAPVVSDEGKVIGLVHGGTAENGKMRVALTSLRSVQSFFDKTR